MRDRVLLEQNFGKSRPFKVPEGYFGQLEDSFARKLKERETRLKRQKIMIFRYVACAACLVIIAVSAFVLFHSGVNEDLNCADSITKSNSSSLVNDYMIDEISDYAMLDNDDIYSYVSGE